VESILLPFIEDSIQRHIPDVARLLKGRLWISYYICELGTILARSWNFCT